MAKTNICKKEMLQLIFHNVPMTGIGDAAGLRGSVASGSLYVGLSWSGTTDRSFEDNNQGTYEVGLNDDPGYATYTRIAVDRDPAYWHIIQTLSDPWTTTVRNVKPLIFPVSSPGNTYTIRGFYVGCKQWALGAGAAGKLLYYGNLDPFTVISGGDAPFIHALGLLITEA